MKNSEDVLIIGAGPAGSVAAKLLAEQGFSVRIIERAVFPRFTIGESLLPQCTEFLQQAGLLEVVKNAGFQLKNGAFFVQNRRHAVFDFNEQFTLGYTYTYQVKRADFDQLLADQAQQAGASIHYGTTVESISFDTNPYQVAVVHSDGSKQTFFPKFVLDASGFARVLPKFLSLGKPADFPARQSLFTHIEDHINADHFDRNKIVIAVHPEHSDVWYWLIPFSDGTSSIGVVASESFFDKHAHVQNDELLKQLCDEEPNLKSLLKEANWPYATQQIKGYAYDISRLYDEGYAVLGNAAQFLDPVFSSGVTIALKSALLAVKVLSNQLQDLDYNWDTEFAQPLSWGVETFRAYVEAWYDGGLQDIIFSSVQPLQIKQKICSILGGYVWDSSNEYTRNPKRKLSVLVDASRAINSNNTLQ